MKQEIPQDVRDRVAKEIKRVLAARSYVPHEDLADAIIPLAQLPIAPLTKEEVSAFRWAFPAYALERFNEVISRRNYPPQVDARSRLAAPATHGPVESVEWKNVEWPHPMTPRTVVSESADKTPRPEHTPFKPKAQSVEQPKSAHEWLQDALGRYQVTHIHSSIREALKAMDITEEQGEQPIMCKCGHHPDGHCGEGGACTARKQRNKEHPNDWLSCVCKYYVPCKPSTTAPTEKYLIASDEIDGRDRMIGHLKQQLAQMQARLDVWEPKQSAKTGGITYESA